MGVVVVVVVIGIGFGFGIGFGIVIGIDFGGALRRSVGSVQVVGGCFDI